VPCGIWHWDARLELLEFRNMKFILVSFMVLEVDVLMTQP
jgi:hypothetical protein